MTQSNNSQQASDNVEVIFSEIQQEMGIVPNFFRYQADADPAWLALNWSRWKQIMGEQRALDRKTKEIIALTVSIVNQCDYCHVAHEQAAKMVGVSDAELIEMQQVIELYSSFNSIATSLRIPLDKSSS
ncbi:MAG: hypothetical protein GQ548_01670 [Methylophaga sp.]|nr:hypothetical protein [Methylophaga sp.]